MFSGIVALGHAVTTPGGGEGRLRVAHPKEWSPLRLGDSLSVNGCCLTVVEVSFPEVTLEVMPETMRRTNLGLLLPGNPVNLESALGLGDAVGGHLVTGHVDATGEVVATEDEGNARWITVRVPSEVARYCVGRGSIAIDGCSLTLVQVVDQEVGGLIRVSLIPHTLQGTVAHGYCPGKLVNLEADYLAKLLERLSGAAISATVAHTVQADAGRAGAGPG